LTANPKYTTYAFRNLKKEVLRIIFGFQYEKAKEKGENYAVRSFILLSIQSTL
jgi:hypothetical protein